VLVLKYYFHASALAVLQALVTLAFITIILRIGSTKAGVVEVMKITLWGRVVVKSKVGVLTPPSLENLPKSEVSNNWFQYFDVASTSVVFCFNFVSCKSDGEIADVTLATVLVFATGADCEPPLGFDIHPTLEFFRFEAQYGGKKYPTANTCGLVLHLPVVNTYDEFCAVMRDGMLMAQCFGQH
jgi:hypothetical protein